ncbi:hypothetical protein [Butyrivibrio sp. FCS014]|uniref:hypothetical protein n=1 Tax=Butyrivibrio sp. FCS014 TaxID=1408304 RepID=UPI0004630C60|nr:hypothetical protein [Butyrivibrio sp. FCS014]
MGLLKLEKGQILHKAGEDEVSSLEVIVKGRIKIYDATSSMEAGVGNFIGLAENPGKKLYLFL